MVAATYISGMYQTAHMPEYLMALQCPLTAVDKAHTLQILRTLGLIKSIIGNNTCDYIKIHFWPSDQTYLNVYLSTFRVKQAYQSPPL